MRYLVAILFLFTSITAMAERRTEGEIISLAQSVLQTQATARGVSANTIDNLHIVEQLNGISIVSAGKSGFAVITNDDGQQPVVGYSFSTYDEENIADGFLWWKQAINEVLADGELMTRTSVPSQFKSTVEPLLKTTWNQNYPYYEKCPVVDGEHCVTGCVPTAMAQVLNYYRYPLRGSGVHDDIDFNNITFEWGNMLPDYLNGTFVQKEAVATLMYACGKAIDTEYHKYESLATLNNVVKALKSYFGYDSPQILYRDSYEGDWASIIYGELSNGSPVIYSGESKNNSNPSHAFVLDGYDADGNVHVNWGWGGRNDGYYNIDALKPGHDFTADQEMIYNIRNYIEQPELSTCDIRISGTRQAGVMHTLRATITNSGTDFSGVLHLFVSQDTQNSGTFIAQQSINIASSAEVNITFPFTPATDGKYCLQLTADSEGDNVVGKIYLDIGEDEALIVFSDKIAEQVCNSTFDLNGDNELSFKEAAAVKSLKFDAESRMRTVRGLGKATSFDELKYFTSLTSIPAEIFAFFDENTFSYNSFLKSVSLPPSIKTIEESAFQDCLSLEKVTFSDNTQLEEIPAYAFTSCKKLNNIVLPASVKTISNYAFTNCESLESIVLSQNLVSIGEKAFKGCKSLKTITLPDAVQSIGAMAFYDCESLKEASLNEGLKSIGEQAFYECCDLNSIVIPISLEQLGSKVFYCGYQDNYLQHVYVKWEENPFVGTGDEIDVYRSSEAQLHVPVGTKALYESVLPWKNFNIIVEEIEPNDDPNIINFADNVVRGLCIEAWDTNGDNYLSMEEAAAVTDLGTVFNDNKDIKTFDELKYFTGLTSIANRAFRECQRLTSITLPNTVKSIEDAAFEHCNKLSEIIIPNSVKAIGNWAFETCSALSTVTIGSRVTEIGKCAFNRCGNLTSVYVQNPVPIAIYDQTFSNCTNATLYVPNGCVDVYKSANYWKEFGQILESGKDAGAIYDVNGDGRVDIVDVTNIISYISGQTPDGFDITAADINSDGKVNIADVVSLINIILDKNE